MELWDQVGMPVGRIDHRRSLETTLLSTAVDMLAPRQLQLSSSLYRSRLFSLSPLLDAVRITDTIIMLIAERRLSTSSHFVNPRTSSQEIQLPSSLTR